MTESTIKPCHKNAQELTYQQRKALYLLVEGMTVSDVAEEIGVRRETVGRWRQLPAFRKEYDEIMTRMRHNLQHRMTSLTDHVLQCFIMNLYNDQFDTWDMFKLLEQVCWHTPSFAAEPVSAQDTTNP